MNAPRKNSAVKKYESLYKNGGSIEDLKLALSGDEKAYTPDEIAEIVAAITAEGKAPEKQYSPPAPKEAEKPAVVKPEPKKPVKAQPAEEKTGYEEWRMEWVAGKLQKLKLLRPNVKISDQEAETLNAGAQAPGSFNPIMYFKPE